MKKSKICETKSKKKFEEGNEQTSDYKVETVNEDYQAAILKSFTNLKNKIHDKEKDAGLKEEGVKQGDTDEEIITFKKTDAKEKASLPKLKFCENSKKRLKSRRTLF